MESLLRQMIEQNERLIFAVERLGDDITQLRHDLKNGLVEIDTTSNLHSIDQSLSEISLAIQSSPSAEVLADIHSELQTIALAVERIDTALEGD